MGDLNRDNQVDVNDVLTLVDIILKGYTPFSVSPEEITMQAAGSTATVNIIGGYYFYEVVSANPNVVEASVFGMTVALNAVGGGQTTVTVKDVLTFRTIDIPVTVEYDALQLSSNNISLIVGEQSVVDITSGSGSYSVLSSNENVATATVSGGNVTVTAVGAGTGTITVTDIKTGQTANIEVMAEYMPIVLASSSVNLSFGEEKTVNITSGSGSYSVQSSNPNVATAVIDDNSIKVTAVGGGRATITVTDTSSGKTADLTVTVDYYPLTLSASSLTMNVGDEEIVDITSGNGSYSVQSSDSNVATAIIDDNSIKVTAVGGGTTVITVTDTSSGKTADLTVMVKYPICPDDHHPHLIDLGLPSGTKWACCNVDDDHSKQSPTNYGSYYAWGETKKHEDLIYDWSTYIHCDGSMETCHDLGSDIAGTQYDVAHYQWGGSWVMPSKEQLEELFNKCTVEWATVNGVNGFKFISKSNGASIFLPAAGLRRDSDLYGVGWYGYYWSSLPSSPNPSVFLSYAYYLSFNSGGAISCGNSVYSAWGISVRPVARN